MQSQFSYAPLVWMLHSKTVQNRINKVHEKFLKLLYDDHDSNFKELLDKEGTFTIHQINTQKLMIEMFKAKNDIGPKLLSEIFKTANYNGPKPKKTQRF